MKGNILITGASSGIGEAVSRELSEQGYTVILVARNEEKLLRISSEIGNNCYTYPFDLEKLDRIKDIFEFCRKQGILLNGMVHCAGMTTTVGIRENDISVMESVFKVNCEAFLELGKHFLKRKYSENNSGVVAISSLAAQRCKKGTAVYSASKAALDAAVAVMAKESEKRNIRVNSICPGYVDTGMIDYLAGVVGIQQEQKLGIIEPEYIAYLTEFLLSDKAKYITDAHIPVSAGLW